MWIHPLLKRTTHFYNLWYCTPFPSTHRHNWQTCMCHSTRSTDCCQHSDTSRHNHLRTIQSDTLIKQVTKNSLLLHIATFRTSIIQLLVKLFKLYRSQTNCCFVHQITEHYIHFIYLFIHLLHIIKRQHWMGWSRVYSRWAILVYYGHFVSQLKLDIKCLTKPLAHWSTHQ